MMIPQPNTVPPSPFFMCCTFWACRRPAMAKRLSEAMPFTAMSGTCKGGILGVKMKRRVMNSRQCPAELSQTVRQRQIILRRN
jgi:hypothetical protein